ncbi:hypothetical protein I79_006676 [Cricetulus griseus]|uniref:Uncharacterized protein n=1 Tax=Cricetulus griseus TaxID=10029 RepID=G3H8H6_CRIGR|nr:hypothetical protein I79_006676 [Cricetulus griseus]
MLFLKEQSLMIRNGKEFNERIVQRYTAIYSWSFKSASKSKYVSKLSQVHSILT